LNNILINVLSTVEYVKEIFSTCVVYKQWTSHMESFAASTLTESHKKRTATTNMT